MTKIKMPEPVATVNVGGKKLRQIWFKEEEVRSLIDTRVKEALERAAAAIESRIGTGTHGLDLSDYDVEAQDCANLVRSFIA